MTTDSTPAKVRMSAGLGLAFPERDYLDFDPCEGDRDADVRFRTVNLLRARKEHSCFGGADPNFLPARTKRLTQKLSGQTRPRRSN